MRLGKHKEKDTTKADERAWHGRLDRNMDRKDPSTASSPRESELISQIP